MRLAHRGLLIVGIPLFLQTVLLIVLSVFLWQLQDESEKQAQSEDIVQRVFRMETDLATVAKSSLEPQPDIDYTDKLINTLDNQFSELVARLQLRPGQEKNAKDLSNISAESKVCLARWKMQNQPNSLLKSPEKNANAERMVRLARDLVAAGQNAIAVEVAAAAKLPLEKSHSLNQIYIALAIAGGLTVLACLGLTYFASASIRAPLKRMADNAAAISTRQPLAKPLTGKDELAELDQLLHFVNDEVEAALNKERNLIDFAADLVCSIDAAGIFRSVNPYSYDLLGYAPEALIGSALLRCLPGEEVSKADTMLSGQRDQSGRIFEMRMLRKDKTEVETSWSAIWSRVERLYFCVAHDISERKHVERLKQDYIAMISHDLRSPLMSILGSINMMQMKAASVSDQAKADLAGAERSVEHLIALVNDLLDFEKLEAGQMEFEMAPLQLTSIFNESEPLVESLLDKFDVRLVFPDTDLKVRADSTKLLQLMVNLISNAIKHSPPDATVKIVLKKLADAIEVSVHDQGPGVPAQDSERIFQPFEQISERSTATIGTGLGLAICRLIAQGHKGTIGVRQSEILGGSAFWFTIPTPRR